MNFSIDDAIRYEFLQINAKLKIQFLGLYAAACKWTFAYSGLYATAWVCQFIFPKANMSWHDHNLPRHTNDNSILPETSMPRHELSMSRHVSIQFSSRPYATTCVILCRGMHDIQGSYAAAYTFCTWTLCDMRLMDLPIFYWHTRVYVGAWGFGWYCYVFNHIALKLIC